MIDPDIVDYPRVRVFTNSVAFAHVSAEFFEYFLGTDLSSHAEKRSLQKKLEGMAKWLERAFLNDMRESIEKREKLIYEFKGFVDDGKDEEVATLTYNTATMSDDDFLDHYRDIIHHGIMLTLEDKETQKKLAEIILETEES